MKRFCVFALALLSLALCACSAGLEPVKEESLSLTVEKQAEKKAEAKEKTTEEKVFEDPKEDGALNILLIGNSYSYYWCDELYGMLAAAGHENAKIYNVYYSGCSFDKHWNWLENHETNYQLFCNDKNGRRSGDDLLSFPSELGYYQLSAKRKIRLR